MTEYRFAEQELHEAGFADVYENEVSPFLKEMEILRTRSLAKRKLWVGIVIPLSAGLAFWSGVAVHPALAFFPLFLGFVLAFLLWVQRGDKVERAAAAFLPPVLCRFLGSMEMTREVPGGFMPLERLRDLRLLPHGSEANRSLAVTGQWRDVNYKVLSLTCRQRERDSEGDVRYREVFSGILLQVDCPADMPCTVFLRDFGETLNKVNKWSSPAVPPHRWEFADPGIENVFEVYSDDIDRASQHLGQNFPCKFIDMAKSFQGGREYCEAAFEGHDFYLALRLPHRFLGFNLGNDPLHLADEPIRRALADLVMPRRVIDMLLD